MKKVIVLSALAVVVVASPAWAFKCPSLVKQIDDTVSNRFDAVASQAKVDSANAAKLHAEGKHAESQKLAQDTLDKLAVKQ
jgi:hypothetical protein